MTESNGKAKYYILMEALKNDILASKINPGDKLPSENQLANMYGISRHTVRKALSILENEGFIAAEHGRGTFCSERLRFKDRSHNIAVITTYISDYIFPRLIQGIDTILTQHGYSIILKNTGNSQKNEAKCLEDILTKNIDGIIIEPSKSEIFCKHMHLYHMLDELSIPYIFVQGIYPQLRNKPYIIMDDVKGGYLLTKYLIDMGHRNIAGVFKVDDTQGKERHKGYVMALQEAGFAYDPDKVIWFHTEDREYKPSSGIKQLYESNVPFDSVICYNDQIAYKIIVFLEKLGVNV
ncbi:MAG TPA: GntR family transcriptional regulator, partial [Lachnospiraceae bacterium]|nr:GntR family transcriptional regulator [Lachnospiraceae bacterium]